MVDFVTFQLLVEPEVYINSFSLVLSSDLENAHLQNNP
jgi:hypothetical protein